MITKYKILSTKYSAFTLIELLVVISIIGILAAMVTLSFTASQRQARDTQRKSDLSQYRSSLEAYANKSNGIYPIYAGTAELSGTVCPNKLDTGGSCPNDPKFATNGNYNYQSDALGTQYVLWTTLENATTTFWVVCSGGQSGKISSGTSISGGNCPASLTP